MHTAPPAAPILNSIADNPDYGDERKFTQIRNVATGSDWLDSIDLTMGDIYEVSVFYHNNSHCTPLKHAVAEVEVPWLIPAGTAAFLHGRLNTPQSALQDSVTISNRGHGDIALRYWPNSAVVATSAAGSVPISWSQLISGSGFGVTLGTHPDQRTLQPNDSGRILFQLQADGATFKTAYGVQMAGTEGWAATITAHPGDVLAFLISYSNVGTVEQTDVVLKNEWPAGLRYINGTAKLHTDSTPSDGQTVDDGIGAGGINIGTYLPGGDGHLTFRAHITATGPTTLVNRAYVETGNGWTEHPIIIHVT